MAKTATKYAPAQIDINDSKAIRYWCRRLRCRQSDLIAAVIVLGPGVAGVERSVEARCDSQGRSQ